jgi:hypothetical protein
MNAVVPILMTMPDGTERPLRATLGARKRIKNHFNESNIQVILTTGGDEALAEIIYFMLFDEKGNPPSVSMAEFNESFPWASGTQLLALVLSAFSQGKTDPKEMEEQLLKLQALDLETTTGSTSGPSAESPSDSATETSGTDSSNAKLTLLEKPSENESDAPPSSPRKRTTTLKA